jgi:hypothetical protein
MEMSHSFIPLRKDTSMHWLAVLVGLMAGLDVVVKRKILPCQESKPSHPACSLSLY